MSLPLTKTAKFSVLEHPSLTNTSKTNKPTASTATTSAATSTVPTTGTLQPLSVNDTINEADLFTSSMSLDEKVAIAMSVGEEVLMPEELRALYTAKAHPIVYDGFEPSGRMHIAQGVLRAINVNKLTSTGCLFKFWVADWFAQLNNKMDGDLAKIRVVGQYMIEIWKAIGMNMQNVRFLWASDEINAHADEYWQLVMDIARRNSINRIQRCCTIMGRKEEDEMSAAQIFYPCMQCADVFYLKADICQLGLDQRKVNMLAREYATDKKKRFKPIIISHHMLLGLKEGQEKMSKSDPESAIFMEDEAKEVERKIKKAFCPPAVAAGNPVLDYAKHIVIAFHGFIKINNNGVEVTYNSKEELEKEYIEDKIHPGDLKSAVSAAINTILDPVRAHFRDNNEAKQLLEKIKKFKVTR